MFVCVYVVVCLRVVGAVVWYERGGEQQQQHGPGDRTEKPSPTRSPTHLLLEPFGGLVPPQRHQEPEHEEEHGVEAPQRGPNGGPGDVDALVRLEAEEDCRVGWGG